MVAMSMVPTDTPRFQAPHVKNVLDHCRRHSVVKVSAQDHGTDNFRIIPDQYQQSRNRLASRIQWLLSLGLSSALKPL